VPRIARSSSSCLQCFLFDVDIQVKHSVKMSLPLKRSGNTGICKTGGGNILHVIKPKYESMLKLSLWFSSNLMILGCPKILKMLCYVII